MKKTILFFILFAILIGISGCGDNIADRQTFESEEEMKAAVVGMYSGENEKIPDLEELRKITEDYMIICYESIITGKITEEGKDRIEWNPEKGTFESWGGTWEVLKTGDIKHKKTIYSRSSKRTVEDSENEYVENSDDEYKIYESLPHFFR